MAVIEQIPVEERIKVLAPLFQNEEKTPVQIGRALQGISEKDMIVVSTHFGRSIPTLRMYERVYRDWYEIWGDETPEGDPRPYVGWFGDPPVAWSVYAAMDSLPGDVREDVLKEKDTWTVEKMVQRVAQYKRDVLKQIRDNPEPGARPAAPRTISGGFTLPSPDPVEDFKIKGTLSDDYSVVTITTPNNVTRIQTEIHELGGATIKLFRV